MACNPYDPTNCPRKDWNVPPFNSQAKFEPWVHQMILKWFNWDYHNFVYIPSSVPEDVAAKYRHSHPFLGNWNQVLIGTALYLTIVLGGRQLMKNREPFVLKWPFIIHNVILVFVSAILLICLLEILVPMILNHGFQWSVCDPKAYDLRLVPFYYANYLVKWWEFIDTFFLVLKKKKLEVLHVYHHAATMVLTFSQLWGQTAVQWVPITINLLVHVIMYYYYARTTLIKKPVWWKKHLTTLQIIQFVIDLGVIYYIMHRALGARVPSYHNLMSRIGFPLGEQDCYGDIHAGYFGTAIISSYLWLFIDFFIRTYKKSTAKKAKSQ